MRTIARAVAALLLAVAPAFAADVAYLPCGRILTPGAPAIEGGAIVIRDGVVTQVGKDVKRPPFSRVIDARGRVVTPGFVLAATRISMPPAPPPPPGDAIRVPMQLDVKASDELRARHPDFEMLLDAGITTVGLLPVGNDPGVPGLVSAVLTRPDTAARQVLQAEAALVVDPATHAPWRRAMTEALEKAESEKKKKAKPAADGKPPEGGAKSTLQRALAKELPVLLVPGSLAQWTAARDVLPIEKMRASVGDLPDLYFASDDIAASGARVLTEPVLTRERGTRMPVSRAARWERAGVPYAFVLPDDAATDAGLLREGAIEMLRAGCSREKVLAALTSEGAATLGLESKVGRIAPGQRADLLVWSGDPFDPTTRLEQVIVGGEAVERPALASLVAEGDRDAADARLPPERGEDVPALPSTVPFDRPAPPVPTSRPATAEIGDDEERIPASERSLDVEPLALVGGLVHPVTSRDVEGGTVLLRDGRIEAVLPRGTRVPDGYRELDVTGRHVYPGMVAASADALGLDPDAFAGGGEAAIARGIAESLDAWSDQVELAASAGVTSACVMRNASDAKGPLGGRGAILKMSPREPRATLVLDPACIRASRALLTPNGMQAFEQMLDRAMAKSRKSARKDPMLDLARALAERRIPLVATGGSPGELLALADLAERRNLRLVVVESADAWAVADRLAGVGAAALANVRFTWGKPRADRRTSLGGGFRADAATRLLRAGVPTAIVPWSDTIELWGVAGRDLLNLPLEAAAAQRGGFTAQEALESITIVPARIFGVDDRLGSIEPGKDADLVVTDGDLLDYRTLVRTTIVSGRVAYEAAGNRFWKGIVERRDRALEDGSALPPPPSPPPRGP